MPRSNPGTPLKSNASSRADGDGQEWKPLIDPMQVVRGIARSKLLIVTTTILGAALGIAIALSTPKKYEATTELIVDPRDLKLTDRDLTQSVCASDATLAIVENKLRDADLRQCSEQGRGQAQSGQRPGVQRGGQPAALASGRSSGRSCRAMTGRVSVDEVRRRALAVGNLAESLSVERGGKTFVITISATTQNGEKSALIANTMTEVVPADLRPDPVRYRRPRDRRTDVQAR